MYFSEHDVTIVRQLASRYAETAHSPENEQHIRRAYRANDLGGGRPFVSIEELPWNEMNCGGVLDLHCEDPFAREVERFFRRELYRWDCFRADRIFYPAYYVDKSFSCTDMGIRIEEDTIATDAENPIVSHSFKDVLPDEEALKKIHPMTVTPHPEQDERNVSMAEELLGGILPVQLRGVTYFYFAPWDQLVRYHGVENTFFDLIDRPEFLHKMVERYIDVHWDYLDQLDRYGLLGDFRQDSLHCTSSLTTALPVKEPGQPYHTEDMWLRLTAQSFGSCSAEVYRLFEIEHCARMAERFGRVYYGCCEPLERVIPTLKKYPKVRKIGVSPFADAASCAEQIGRDYTLSRKPNPSYVAVGLAEDAVRREVRETAALCERFGCSYDYTLKDISTVGRDPRNIFGWAKAVAEELDAIYGTDD